jgi:hypothetical protein
LGMGSLVRSNSVRTSSMNGASPTSLGAEGEAIASSMRGMRSSLRIFIAPAMRSLVDHRFPAARIPFREENITGRVWSLMRTLDTSSSRGTSSSTVILSSIVSRRLRRAMAGNRRWCY